MNPILRNTINQILINRGISIDSVVDCHLSYDGYYKVQYFNDVDDDNYLLIHCTEIINELCNELSYLGGSCYE